MLFKINIDKEKALSRIVYQGKKKIRLKTIDYLNNSNKAFESSKAQIAALDYDPTVADLNNANKTLESAKTSLRLAKHTRDELVEGIEATIAMYGEQPAWRTFEAGMAEGLDVFQLEQNLVALGYDET